MFCISELCIAQESFSLFNGKNLEGWYGYESKTGKHKNGMDLFSIQDSMIRMYGDNPRYLISEKSFKDFELTAEFKWNTAEVISKKSNPRNSGIMYLVPSEIRDTIWPKGIQFQIKEGATGDFILLQGISLTVKGEKIPPGPSVVSPRFVDATSPLGEWNILVITSKNGLITQELNGVLVNQGSDPSESAGRILLQYEGFPIDFRKLRIKLL